MFAHPAAAPTPFRPTTIECGVLPAIKDPHPLNTKLTFHLDHCRSSQLPPRVVLVIVSIYDTAALESAAREQCFRFMSNFFQRSDFITFLIGVRCP